MSAPLATPLFVECPECGQRLNVRAEDHGRRGRCQQCGRVFRISVGESPEDRPVPREPPVAPPAPTTVTFPCSLCETRITAGIADVGRTVKCPDCGRGNVIPAPPPPVTRRPLRALEGAQYELWGVNEAPTSAEISARSPTLHPVECGLCRTLMYATDRQIGTKLKCPDCGAMTVAHARQPTKPIGSVLVPPGEEYQLDEASAPTPRPVPMPVAVRDAEMHLATRAGWNASARAGGSRATDARPTRPPKLPVLPVFRGVLPMLLSMELLKRWVILSGFLCLVLWFGSQAALASNGGMAAISALCFLAIGCILAVLWTTSAAPLWLAIVTESSDGHDELQDPPRWASYEWFSETFYMLVAGSAAAAAAWLVAKGADVAGLPPQWRPLAAAAAWLFCFPVLLLSALDEGSPLDIFSARVLSSLVRCKLPWALFFIASSAWMAGFGLAFWKLGEIGGPWIWTLPWLAFAATLVYSRVIGRLAWWLAERMPPDEAEPAA